MITQELREQSNIFFENVINKASGDEEFRKELISNTRKTLSIAMGDNNSFTINNDKEIIVEDQTDDSIVYLNIPQKPNLEELELTEDQLEMVSGGSLETIAAIATIAGFAIGLFPSGDSGGGDVIINNQEGINNSFNIN